MLNGRAGTLLHGDGKGLSDRLRQQLAADHDLLDFQLVEPDAMEAALSRAFGSEAEVVLVGGGDGTLQHAARMAMDSGKVLGILPLGTLNILARDLEIPLDVERAAGLLRDGAPQRIDVAEVGGELCLLKAMGGRLSATIRLRESQRRHLRALAWLRMGWLALRALLRRRGSRFRLSIDGEPMEIRAAVLIVSLNRFSGRLDHPFARDRLDGGRLVVYGLSTGASRQHGRDRFMQARASGLLDSFILAEGREVVVATRRSHVHLSIDGELRLFKSPVTIRILPRALTVLMPGAAETA
ncbi:MAG: diacylglycerol kinase family protein [Sneathiellaceae bacterium]